MRPPSPLALRGCERMAPAHLAWCHGDGRPSAGRSRCCLSSNLESAPRGSFSKDSTVLLVGLPGCKPIRWSAPLSAELSAMCPVKVARSRSMLLICECCCRRSRKAVLHEVSVSPRDALFRQRRGGLTRPAQCCCGFVASRRPQCRRRP